MRRASGRDLIQCFYGREKMKTEMLSRRLKRKAQNGSIGGAAETHNSQATSISHSETKVIPIRILEF